MSRYNDYSEVDKLRARFTSWLSTTLINAKRMYYRAEKARYETVSLAELPMEYKIDPVDHFERVERTPNAFDFEEERLSKAFFELPLMRREVLRLLFVCEMTPEEIAKRLHCSTNYVCLQKYYALKKLRKILEE